MTQSLSFRLSDLKPLPASDELTGEEKNLETPTASSADPWETSLEVATADFLIDIYDADDIRRELLRSGADLDGDDTNLPEPETLRAAVLRAVLHNREGPSRRLLRITQEISAAFAKVADSHPHFASISAIVSNAMALATRTDTPFHLPSLLLVGGPGVGKTHYSRALATSLGTPFIEVAMNALDDSGSLMGHSLSWRAARAGIVAQTLIQSRLASPIILLDEIDKVTSHAAGEQPLHALHSVLEPENARAFIDAYLGFPLRAEHVLWIATANGTETIPPSILDRFLVLRPEEMSRADREKILQASLEEIAASLRGMKYVSAEQLIEVIDPALSVRQLRRVLRLAFAAAAGAGRELLDPGDIAEVQDLVQHSQPGTRQPIGFVANGTLSDRK